MTRPTHITIDLNALRHNLSMIRSLAPKSHVIAMVKSNAYGHGLESIALALHDVEAFGVAAMEEGLQLRAAGVRQPIFLMEGLFGDDELWEASNQDFTLIVHHEPQVAMLERAQDIKPVSTWLKIDTGMHRLGFDCEDVASMHARLQACDAVRKPIGLMSHFAEADADVGKHTQQQIERFHACTAAYAGPRSLANSAGILAWPDSHADWVRPGLMLYGASPLQGVLGPAQGLLPVMSLTSELIAIKELKAGDRVGYGGTWSSPEDMRIGVVCVGYGDGYPRHADTGTPVLVNGEVCSLVGRVSMDMLTVDLRTQPEARVGDPVVLWGKGLPVEIVAAYSGTLAYELLTRITQRVRVVIRTDTKVCV